MNSTRFRPIPLHWGVKLSMLSLVMFAFALATSTGETPIGGAMVAAAPVRLEQVSSTLTLRLRTINGLEIVTASQNVVRDYAVNRKTTYQCKPSNQPTLFSYCEFIQTENKP